MGVPALRADEPVARTPKVPSVNNEEVLVQKKIGSWVTIIPVLVDRNQGICDVTFNPSSQDFSVFNTPEELHSLLEELTEVANSPEVKSMEICFEGCRSLDKLNPQKPPDKISGDNKSDISGPNYLAESLMLLKCQMESAGKILELSCVEGNLFKILEPVKDHFIHRNRTDALMDARTTSMRLRARFLPHIETDTNPLPPLSDWEFRVIHPEDYQTPKQTVDIVDDHLKNPATVEIEGNYLG